MKVEKIISDNKWEGTPDDCDQLKLSRKMEAYHQDRNHQLCLCMYCIPDAKRQKKKKEERIRSKGQKKKKKKKDQGTKGRCKKTKEEKKRQGTKSK